MVGRYDPRTQEHVVDVIVEQVTWHGRMAYGHGRDDAGRAVSFVAEPTMLATFEAAIGEGRQPVAAVPTWALFAGPRA